MQPEYNDKPNVVYQILGFYINDLASIGATEFELKQLMRKAEKVTLKDIAEIRIAHQSYVDESSINIPDSI